MAQVLVLGDRGMLGSTVSRRLGELGFDVRHSDERYGGRADDPLILAATRPGIDAVVNCAGVVTMTLSGPELMIANGLMPWHLAARLEGRVLIQPSTDCVFDGRRGWYGSDETPNASDAYGLSKRLGETCVAFPNVYVLRTSIVGPPGEAGRGLLGWYLRQPGPVDGWIDHVWNGITTLAWADLVGRILAGSSSLLPGLHQPTTPGTITKYDLLKLFGEVFDHPLEVRPVTTAKPLDRSLAPSLAMPRLRDQLATLQEWMGLRAPTGSASAS